VKTFHPLIPSAPAKNYFSFARMPLRFIQQTNINA
jgi:hypothetical protein